MKRTEQLQLPFSTRGHRVTYRLFPVAIERPDGVRVVMQIHRTLVSGRRYLENSGGTRNFFLANDLQVRARCSLGQRDGAAQGALKDVG